MRIRSIKGAAGLFAVCTMNADMVHKFIGGKTERDSVMAFTHVAVVIDPLWRHSSDARMEFERTLFSVGAWRFAIRHCSFLNRSD